VGDDEVRMLLRTDLDRWDSLAAALADLRARRSARKAGGGVQVRMDPPDLAS
jgi:hypothetical protein